MLLTAVTLIPAIFWSVSAVEDLRALENSGETCEAIMGSNYGKWHKIFADAIH